MATGTNHFDVVVLGGGLAGLTAALQLKRARPQTSILVAEKGSYPVPEVAWKVGESIAEIASHYLKNVLGLQDHLEQDQIRKMSLRIFSSANGNDDIARRPEIGLSRFSPLRTYQVDRGRLENHLVELVTDAGVDLRERHAVAGLSLGSSRHSVTLHHDGGAEDVTADWIIDASGRAGILRRQLRLGVGIAHDVNAAWFRTTGRIRVDDWSHDPAWQARVPSGTRWMSTCHLVGEGYWVWLIPLPSGPTSVGVVADERFVPFERIRRYDVLREWLAEAEPQLHAKLPQSEDQLLDFRKVKNYAYGVRRGLSPQRWCLTGEAGLFLDPLYATGLDFIAIANTFATRLIHDALDGAPDADLKRRLKAYNRYYMGQFLGWEPAFAGQYEVFRGAQATAAKVLWDNAAYFMYPVLLFTKGYVTDHELMASISDTFKPHYAMNLYMQERFRVWSRAGAALQDAGFPVGSDELIGELFDIAQTDLTRAEVEELIGYNLLRLQAVSHDLVERFNELAGGAPPPMPYPERPAEIDASIIQWSSYEQRTAPPAQTEPQPAGAWMLR